MSQNPTFTITEIKQAISLLYSTNQHPDKIKQINKYLQKAQRSKQAWEIAFNLIENNESVMVQHYGASTLTEKVTYHFNEIPEDFLVEFRDKILLKIVSTSAINGHKIVTIKLCVALASLASQMIAKNVWTNVIQFVVEYFVQNHETVALLKFLTIVAEELREDSKTWLILGKNDRKTVRFDLLNSQDLVINLLYTFISNGGTNTPTGHNENYEILSCRCMSAWVQLGINFSKTASIIDKFLNVILIKTQDITNPEKFAQLDFDAIEEYCDCVHQAFCTSDSHQYPNLVLAFTPKILALRALLEFSINSENIQLLTSLVKLICGFGENMGLLIISNYYNTLNGIIPTGMGRNFFDLALACTSNKLQYPTIERATPLSLSFWYSVQDAYTYIDRKKLPNYREMEVEIEATFFKLMDVLVMKSLFPDFESLDFSQDEQEEFRIFRVDVSDTLMYTYNILEMKMVAFLASRIIHFSNLYLAVSKELNSDNQNPQLQENFKLQGQYLESYINAFTSVAEGSDLEKMPETQTIIQQISQISLLPNNNEALTDSILNLIGSLSEYIYYNPEPSLTHFLPIIFNAFNPARNNFNNENPVVLTAILSLKRITRETVFGIQPHALQILEVCKLCLNSQSLKQTQISWLMQCAGHCLSVIKDNDVCQKQTEELLESQCKVLDALCSLAAGEIENEFIDINLQGQTVRIHKSRQRVIEIVSNLRNLYTTVDRGIIRKTKEQEVIDLETGFEDYDGVNDGSTDNISSTFGLNDLSENSETTIAENDYYKANATNPVSDDVLTLEWQPMLNSLTNVIPLIEKVALVFAKDDDVLSDACTLFERLSKNLEQFFKQILHKIVPTLTRVFEIKGALFLISKFASIHIRPIRILVQTPVTDSKSVNQNIDKHDAQNIKRDPTFHHIYHFQMAITKSNSVRRSRHWQHKRQRASHSGRYCQIIRIHF